MRSGALPSKILFVARLAARSMWLAARGACLAVSAWLSRRRPADSGGDPLLVLYSQVAWPGVWQRPQEQALRLARRRRVLYVSPVQVHETLWRYPAWKFRQTVGESAALSVLCPLVFSGEYRWPWVFRLNKTLLRAELRRALRHEGRVILLTNSPFAAPLLDAIAPDRVLYDAIDDFAAFEWAPAGGADMETALLSRADAVITGTGALEDQLRARGVAADYIPGGVDFERFRRPDDPADDPEPEALRGLPRPILGYMGTLSERIDRELLAALAVRFPQASIVLIGPMHRTFGRLPRARNIHFLGLKPPDELPAFVRRFDVALMPFRLIDAVRAINPVKTLEYLAAGCPIVSTAVPDVVRYYSDIVLIGASCEEFLDRVEQALREDMTDRIKRGIARARAATWESMAEEIEKRIGE